MRDAVRLRTVHVAATSLKMNMNVMKTFWFSVINIIMIITLHIVELVDYEAQHVTRY